MEKEPTTNSEDKEEEYLKMAEEFLREIPKDTPRANLVRSLGTIFMTLTCIDPLAADGFIRDKIKTQFDLKTVEVNDYIKRVRGLAKKFSKKPKSDELSLIIDRDIKYSEVLHAVSEIGVVPEEMLEIAIAVCVSSVLRLNPPLWLLLVGAPSSFKTELVNLFGSLSEVYTLDTMTKNAFVSGFVKKDGSDPEDLLPLLNDKCFIVKDLTTIFSLKEDTVKKLLGDLTSIFDGKFEKFTATRGGVSYSSLFSMIACITPAILAKHHSYVNQLGPRFFFLRVPELTDETRKRGFEIAWSTENRSKKVAHARQLVSSYCAQLMTKVTEGVKTQENRPDVRAWLNNAADFVARARGIAITKDESFQNKEGKEIEYYDIKDHQVEQPWRALRQLHGYASVLAFMRGKSSITLEECRALRPLLISTMQVNRAEIVQVLITSGGLSASEIAKRIQKSAKTIRRSLKELEVLGLTDAYKRPSITGGVSPWFHFVSEPYADLLEAQRPSGDFLSQSKKTSDEDDDFYGLLKEEGPTA